MNDKRKNEAFSSLDRAQRMIRTGSVHDAMDHLMEDLRTIRTGGIPSMKAVLSREELLVHPLTEVIHQDPMTYRAFSKPRGYPGDAELLDYIYRLHEPVVTSDTGLDVGRYCLETGASRSVRARREILAGYIDRVADAVDRPTIVSIACGHLREALISKAVIESRVGDLIAVDQDAESLATVESSLRGLPVRTVQASVRQMISGNISFPHSHLVYAAGLYDYLELTVARRLTARMFGMLGHGGKLLVANFAPDLREIGYMETFMDWHLIYRDEAEMMLVASEIDDRKIHSLRLFRDEPGNLVFLELVRA